MEGKKISFGFTKTRRAVDVRLPAPVQARPSDERRDYIDCVEENAIKVVGGEVIEEKKPLVIPLKPNTLMTAERMQQIEAEVEGPVEDKQEPSEQTAQAPKVENETLEQQAERELIEEARNIKKVETNVLTVPVPTLPPLVGQKESTLDDYESVPIADFGMAMLRGMGWTPGKASKYAQPTLRPKGLGLGADKLVKQGAEKKVKGGKDEGELKLNKGSYVKIVAGKHNGAYAKVVSLDEESGRAVVELALGRGSVSVGEHVLQLVSRRHYDERSRVINADKYEEYKNKEALAKDKEISSKKASHRNPEQSTSRHPETSKGDANGRNKVRSSYDNTGRHIRKDSLSSDDENKRDSHKESKRTDARRYLPSSEHDRSERRSRNENSAQRSLSSNGDNRSHRNESREVSARKRSSSDEDGREGRSRNDRARESRRSSSGSPDKRGLKREDQSNTDGNAIRSASGEVDRTDRASRHDERRARSSTSSEDSRTRRKHKSKDSRKQRERSGPPSCPSSGEHEPSKKSKKKRGGTPVGKRDIDKKRKGKKKKRDRDRSPNHRKHKK